MGVAKSDDIARGCVAVCVAVGCIGTEFDKAKRDSSAGNGGPRVIGSDKRIDRLR